MKRLYSVVCFCLLSLGLITLLGCGSSTADQNKDVSSESPPDSPTEPDPEPEPDSSDAESIGFQLQTPQVSPTSVKNPVFVVNRLPEQDVSVSIYLGLSNFSTCVDTNLKLLGSPVNVEGSRDHVVIDQLGSVLGNSSDGVYRFFAKVTGDNFSQCASLGYTLDTTRPSIVKAGQLEAMSNNETPVRSYTWSWACQDTTACEYRHKISDMALSEGVSQCPDFTFESEESYTATTSATKNSEAGVDGRYCIYIQAKDEAGNTSPVTAVYALLDNTVPSVSEVQLLSGTYAGGDSIDITLTFDEEVRVSGSPHVFFTLGQTSKYAVFQSGSDSTELIFRYTVLQGDGDHDGIGGVHFIDLNSGTLTDLAGNPIPDPLTFTAPNNLSSVLVRGGRANLIISHNKLSVDENGGTTTYRVQLNKAPTNQVIVNLISSSTSIATLHPSSLTFTSSDWNSPKTVTVTGVNDNIDNDLDGSSRTTTLSHSFGGSDPEFSVLSPKTIEVTSQDDDHIGEVRLALNPILMNEHFPHVANTISLNHTQTLQVTATFEGASSSDIQLGQDLILALSVEAGTAQDDDFISPGVQYLTIPSGQSTGTHSFSLTLVDDSQSEERESLQITAASSGFPDLVVHLAHLTIEDNDEEGLILSKPSPMSVEENGGTLTFNVKLATQPSGATLLRLSTGDPSIAQVSPAQLVFEPNDGNGKIWSTNQTVTLTGVLDTSTEDDRSTTISYELKGGGYDEINIPSDSITVTNTDLDSNLLITEAPDILSGNYRSYSLRGTCPEDGIDVTLQVGSVSAVSVDCDNGQWEVNHLDTSTEITANEEGISILAFQQGLSITYTANAMVDRCISSGDGTEASPQLICTYQELQNIKNDFTKHYQLARDIDARPSWSEGVSGCGAYDGTHVDAVNPCSGWVPMGPFLGTLDGGGHKISNLYIHYSNPLSVVVDVGMFTLLHINDTRGRIRNLHLREASIHLASEVKNVGSLVGQNTGTLDNCSATGKIWAMKGVESMGGLAGYQQSGKTYNSYTDMELVLHTNPLQEESATISIGGLVGYLRMGNVISSYARGSTEVIGQHEKMRLGGLVGDFFIGSVYNSYSQMRALSSATGDQGGVVGRALLPNLPSAVHISTISHSYFAGSSLGEGVDSTIGSFPAGGSYPLLFWDKTLFPEDSGAPGAVGLTSGDMLASCPAGSSLAICNLGDGFDFTAGRYPRVKKCTHCVVPSSSDAPIFSTDLVGGQ